MIIIASLGLSFWESVKCELDTYATMHTAHRRLDDDVIVKVTSFDADVLNKLCRKESNRQASKTTVRTNPKAFQIDCIVRQISASSEPSSSSSSSSSTARWVGAIPSSLMTSYKNLYSCISNSEENILSPQDTYLIDR